MNRLFESSLLNHVAALSDTAMGERLGDTMVTDAMGGSMAGEVGDVGGKGAKA